MDEVIGRDLSLPTLDDAHLSVRRHRLGQFKARLFQQRSVFVQSPFLPAGNQEHHKIEELSVKRLVPRWDHALDEENFAFASHCTVTVSQDRDALLLIPVVDDMPQDVDVGSFGHRLKEASFDNPATILEP